MDGMFSGEDGSGTEMDGDGISRSSIDVNGSEELSSANTDSEVPAILTTEHTIYFYGSDSFITEHVICFYHGSRINFSISVR